MNITSISSSLSWCDSFNLVPTNWLWGFFLFIYFLYIYFYYLSHVFCHDVSKLFPSEAARWKSLNRQEPVCDKAGASFNLTQRLIDSNDISWVEAKHSENSVTSLTHYHVLPLMKGVFSFISSVFWLWEQVFLSVCTLTNRWTETQVWPVFTFFFFHLILLDKKTTHIYSIV